MFKIYRVSPKRTQEIVREISVSSQPRGRFFVLLLTSSLIASFGLMANSAAVIIGAMLVSPLMTPIFGIALAMLRGNPRLLWRAFKTEILGAFLAILSGLLVGLPQVAFSDATSEMLARTQPNILDLLVAVFAGYAGTYALLDERVSPALPGVAIATAIVPPLSTCGLCLALGAFSGAFGALLLFLANFVSILLVALVTFAIAGLSRPIPGRKVVRQFGPTVVVFVVIAVILSNSLLRIARDRKVQQVITQTLEEQLSTSHRASLDQLEHRLTPRGIQVLATVRTQRTVSPGWVAMIEETMGERLESPVDLVVRSVRSRDVCALGSSLQAVRPKLDGTFLVKPANDFEDRELLASQVIRETYEREPGFELTRIEYGNRLGTGVVVAYVDAIRNIAAYEVQDLELTLRERLNDPELRFYLRTSAAQLRDRSGSLHVEWTNQSEAPEEQRARIPELKPIVLQTVNKQADLKAIEAHFNWIGDHWKVLVEVIGPGEMTPEGIADIEKLLPESVELLFWRRADYVATKDGYTTYDALVERGLPERIQKLDELFESQQVARTLQATEGMKTDQSADRDDN